MEDADRNDPDARLALVLFRSFRLWDQAELAREAHIAPSQLSAYERGERATPRHVLERAAEAAGFPVYLIDILLSTLRSFRTASRGRFDPNPALTARFAAEMIALAQQAMDLILEPFAQPAGEEDAEPEDPELLKEAGEYPGYS